MWKLMIWEEGSLKKKKNFVAAVSHIYEAAKGFV